MSRKILDNRKHKKSLIKYANYMIADFNLSDKQIAEYKKAIKDLRPWDYGFIYTMFTAYLKAKSQASIELTSIEQTFLDYNTVSDNSYIYINDGTNQKKLVKLANKKVDYMFEQPDDGPKLKNGEGYLFEGKNYKKYSNEYDNLIKNTDLRVLPLKEMVTLANNDVPGILQSPHDKITWPPEITKDLELYTKYMQMNNSEEFHSYDVMDELESMYAVLVADQNNDMRMFLLKYLRYMLQSTNKWYSAEVDKNKKQIRKWIKLIIGRQLSTTTSDEFVSYGVQNIEWLWD